MQRDKRGVIDRRVTEERHRKDVGRIRESKRASGESVERSAKKRKRVDERVETNKERHVEKVKQWRNEIVSYREKTHENFLAEVIGLVSDMDNDIQIEVVPHSMLPHERAEVHLKEGENEWEYNPRFALEDSTRLSILANCGKSAKEVKQVKAEKILSHADQEGRVAYSREESCGDDEKALQELQTTRSHKTLPKRL